MADKGKVLAAAAGLAAGEGGHVHGALAQQLGHIGQGITCQRLVHHHAGAVVTEFHLSGAAIGCRHALRDLGHALVDLLTDCALGVYRADGAPHVGCIRDDVGGLARLEPARGEHAELGRIQLAAVDLLQGNVDVGCCSDGVDAGVGHGAVAALAVDGDVVLLAACHGDAAARHQHRAHRQGHPGQNVEHHGSVHLRVFQQAVFQHVQRALKNFLGRLEFQLHGAFDLVFVGLQQLCRAQHHGGVHIVAAAVHPARDLGSKFLTGFFLNGQGVHVAAQQDGLAGALAACQRENAASAAVLRGIAHFGQGLFHQRFGLRQIKAHLGVAVQGAPPFAQLGFQLFCGAEQFFRCDHFKINSLLFYKENPLGHWP